MAKFKCKYCKEIVDGKNAFKIPQNENNKRSMYFCNENEYLLYENDLKLKENQKLLEQIEKDKFNELDIYIAVEILGNELGQIVPPLLKRRVKELRKNYEYEVIKLCFEYIKQDLNYFLTNTEFKDEQHKINYIMVVVKNTINDTYKIWKRKKELERTSNNISESLQVDVNEIEQISNKKSNKQKNDISAFLSEEDL